MASPTSVTIAPGIGYWGDFPAGGDSLSYIGTPASTTAPTVVNLTAGWNAIGDPYTSSVSISQLTFGTSSITFAKAVSSPANLVSPTLFYYVPGAGGAPGTYSSIGAGGALTAGQGYWIYAYASTTVSFPLPAVPGITNGTTTTSTTTTGTTKRPTKRG